MSLMSAELASDERRSVALARPPVLEPGDWKADITKMSMIHLKDMLFSAIFLLYGINQDGTKVCMACFDI